MNKKQKLVARKHRKNKERIKSLKQASVAIASKKLVTKMEEKVQKVSDKKTTAKKPATKKKTTAKKPATKKKTTAKKPATKKKTTAKKPAVKKKTTAKKSSKVDK